MLHECQIAGARHLIEMAERAKFCRISSIIKELSDTEQIAIVSNGNEREKKVCAQEEKFATRDNYYYTR